SLLALLFPVSRTLALLPITTTHTRPVIPSTLQCVPCLAQQGKATGLVHPIAHQQRDRRLVLPPRRNCIRLILPVFHPTLLLRRLTLHHHHPHHHHPHLHHHHHHHHHPLNHQLNLSSLLLSLLLSALVSTPLLRLVFTHRQRHH